MIKTFPFRLDIEKEYNNRMYSVNSNDLKTVKFTFVVTDNGIPLDLAGLTVRIAIRKPDKKAVWQDCTITNAPKGEGEVILTNQAYIKKGEYEAELMLYKGADTVAITQKFHYRAAEGIMSDKSLKSETVLGPIDEKLAEVEGTLEDLRKNGTAIDAQARQDIENVTTRLAGKANQVELENQKKRIDNIIIESVGDSNPEVADARFSEVKGTTFSTIGNRFNTIENELIDSNITLTNIIENGDFSNGTTQWKKEWQDSTITVENSSLIVTGTGNGFNPNANQQTTKPAIKGHKMFVRATLKPLNPNMSFLKSRLDTGSSAHIELLNISYPVENQIYVINKIIEIPESLTGNLRFKVDGTYANVEIASGKKFEVDNVVIVDLTESFGSGNEPSLMELNDTLPTNRYVTSTKVTNVKQLYMSQKDMQTVGQRVLRHKVLIVDINGLYLNGYDMVFPEEAFKGGYLTEVCSYEAFIANAQDWKYEYDLIIINTQNEIMPDSSITPLQVKNAIKEYMDNGVKVLVFAGDPFLYIRKYNLDGTNTQENLSSLLGNMGSRTAQDFSAKTGQFRHGANYPFSEEILRPECIPSNGWTSDMTSTDTSIVYPIQAYDSGLNRTANVVAYKPNSFAIIISGGTTGSSVSTIPYWKYIKSNIIIDALLGKPNKTRLAIDSVNGRKVVAFGVDCDVTSDLDAINTLRDAFPKDIPIEWGLKTSVVTEEIAGHFRGLAGVNRYVSHTKSHYQARLTMVDELHKIPSEQIITLKKPFKAEIKSIKTKDDITVFTKKSGNILRTAPTEGQYIINEVADTTSPNQLYDGKIKFHANDVGKEIKITYAYGDENAEALGSLDDLRKFGVLTAPCVYTTMGSHSIHHSTILRAEAEGAIISEFKQFPSYTRVWNAYIPTHKNFPLPLGVTAKPDWTGTMVDSDWYSRTKQQAKDNLVNASIARCTAFEIPLVFYTHDIYISKTASSGVWVDVNGTKNADWKKTTYEETRDYIKEMYTWMMNQLKTINPFWMVRSEYEHRYFYLNRHIVYDVQGNKIKVKNEGKETMKGLTFRVPTNSAPASVKLSNGSRVYYKYENGITTVWFDMLPGEIALEIN